MQVTIFVKDTADVVQMRVSSDNIQSVAEQMGYAVVLMPSNEIARLMERRLPENYSVDSSGIVQFGSSYRS